MQIHFLAGAILHATALAVLGFFVLFAAGKAEGIVRLVGMLLGWWLWILAVLAIVCAVACPMMGDKGNAMMDHWGHGGWMHPMGPPPAATPPAPAPATPKKP